MAGAIEDAGSGVRRAYDAEPFDPHPRPEETVPLHPLPQAKPAFDVSRLYVRFRELREDGYVLFDFAIGDPELAVELTLPLAGYLAFCRERSVVYLTREQAKTIDFERSKWRFGAPGLEE